MRRKLVSRGQGSQIDLRTPAPSPPAKLTQREAAERIIAVFRDKLGAPYMRELLNGLDDAASAAQNAPPLGVADGTLHEELWKHASAVHDAMRFAMLQLDRAARDFGLPTPRWCPRCAGIGLEPVKGGGECATCKGEGQLT